MTPERDPAYLMLKYGLLDMKADLFDERRHLKARIRVLLKSLFERNSEQTCGHVSQHPGECASIVPLMRNAWGASTPNVAEQQCCIPVTDRLR